MKRLVWLLAPLLLFLAACGSGTAEVLEPSGVAQPGQETATTSSPNATVGAGETGAAAEANAGLTDDPTVVRERDWKLGAADPAVTIIEYGDFQ